MQHSKLPTDNFRVTFKSWLGAYQEARPVDEKNGVLIVGSNLNNIKNVGF